MFNYPTPPAPPAHGILDAARAALRAIPPAFPLDATVAVNPFLGQTHEGLATAAARLARVAGADLMRPRADFATAIAAGSITDADLSAALHRHAGPHKPHDLAALKAGAIAPRPAPKALPTLADLAADATGTDWPSVIARTFGLWAAGHFDRGQALWSPAPGRPAYSAWQGWASRDLTPEIAGLRGFCAHVGDAPDTADRAILRAVRSLGIHHDAAETTFHRLLMDLGGWAQHARWLLWQAELSGGSDDTLADLLAIRLVWEEALLIHAAKVGPGVAANWQATLAAHAAPVTPGADHVLDAILQDAAERAHQRQLAGHLTQAASAPAATAARPTLQAAFCIDVRSEPFRRALESQDAGIATLGFAGFFGLPVAHRPQGTDLAQAHLPALLRPALNACSHADPQTEQASRIKARATRAWGRFRQAAVSSFAFVEAAGPAYGWKLVQDALPAPKAAAPSAASSAAPRFEHPLNPDQKADTAAAVLRAMSFTQGHARLVLLLGHGAGMTNNPHHSAYQCGACGGQSGEVSARLLAGLLNDPEARAGLKARGTPLPNDTLFVAGLHDTTTDAVTLYADAPAASHASDLEQARGWLARAGQLARVARAAQLPGAAPETLAARARNWAEIRPEWGLAGCAAFIAAPRAQTAAADLQGRAFLHSYDWRADRDFATLDLILTAPVVVASWISLQYYGSAVAPAVFGGGNKLIHNVVGGIGVVQGNGGILRPGLPWQSVHDGARLVHEPLRLSVLIDAPQDAISAVLARHAEVRALFDNGWLHLFALDGGRITARYHSDGTWEGAATQELAA
ncbi:YbcC family protein [Roseicitreum antarcticum]|uniref:Probable inorganic carbon transporter subunit DabA n=1 Tax=Roseicitreum antarcticum TaxID=564137 RepID=A0A1H2SE30_9RHOB|nr:DUF2309 domain-containing protein [Roseicitreum antarcticum]SDW29860.1 hypothetical protein SAMN04488238_101580 [Roseicitreum antarcticum]